MNASLGEKRTDGVAGENRSLIKGAFALHNAHRADDFAALYAADLPSRWLAAKSSLDPTTVLNISTTNDGINGNSGSPIVNARGEVVAAFWGGNDAAMGGNYGYDPARNRAVAVTTAAIGEVLTKVYGGRAITEELVGSAR